MTVNYNEVLRDEGAAAYVTAITAEGAQDVPPQQANLDGMLAEAREIMGRNEGDGNLQAFIEHAESARLLALQAEHLEMNGTDFEFDFSDISGSISNILSNFMQKLAPIMEAFTSGDIGGAFEALTTAFNNEADPQRIAELERQAALAADRADAALAASGAGAAIREDRSYRNDAVAAATSEIDTFSPG